MDEIKLFTNQLQLIRERSLSIIQLINEMPVADLPDDCECADLIDYIDGDLKAINQAKGICIGLIDYDKTM
jgi:hypothetical protein